MILIASDQKFQWNEEKNLENISSWNLQKLFNIHLYNSIIQQCGGMP